MRAVLWDPLASKNLKAAHITDVSAQEFTVPPHPARSYTGSPANIIISNAEQCPIDSFIDQYVETRAMQPDAKLRNEVMEALCDFSCTAPVMLYEMNAWLDCRLSLKALHPDYLEIIDEFGDFPRQSGVARQQLQLTQ